MPIRCRIKAKLTVKLSRCPVLRRVSPQAAAANADAAITELPDGARAVGASDGRHVLRLHTPPPGAEVHNQDREKCARNEPMTYRLEWRLVGRGGRVLDSGETADDLT